MEKLIYRKFKGLEIRCLKCGKTIHKDPSPFNGCKHPIEKTAYRAIIIQPNSNGKRVTVTLKARSYDEAIKELIDYRTDVYNGINKDTIIKQKANPQLLIDCMAMYIDYLSGEDVENPNVKNSKRHVVSKNSLLKTFIKFLSQENFEIEEFKVTDLDKSLAQKYDAFLQTITKSSYTFNHNIKAMRSLFNYLIDKKKYELTNPFREITLDPENSTNVTITSKDFFDLIDIISPKESVNIDGKGHKKNMYRDWLIDAIKLKAFTGRRNEEIFQLRWSNITYENDKPIFMSSPNLKSYRLKKNTRFSPPENTFIPIIKELEDLLNQKGMRDKHDSNDFIIAPNETSDRKTMEALASKSFTFFAKKLSREYALKMKQLRSTYITAQEIYSYRQGPKIQQHSNIKTTNKHYINEQLIAKYISEDRSENRFKVFQ
jgi:integrase